MNFFNKLKLEPRRVLKITGAWALGIVALVFVFSIFSASMRPMFGGGYGTGPVSFTTPGPVPRMALYEATDSYSGKGGVYMNQGMTSLSTRNVLYPVPPGDGGAVGNTAENFEVTDYNASIETRDRESTCTTVAALKSFTYVIFESASESDTQCSYRFKVERARVPEILTAIKALDPKDLSENTQTIKQQLDDFTSETEILEKKLATIEKTLDTALKAYDEITTLAIKTQDADALANIINSKIQMIERLTQERIHITDQLDRLSRAKAQQLDRVDYTYFNVQVYEKKYIDGEYFKDSWYAAIRDFFHNVNQAIQDATINFLGFLIVLLPYVLYALVLVVAAKYGWRVAKYIWEK
ncbi:MAG TPA: hypothetical protein VM103_02055 [Candidatus Paceibacterota bacterium]|nr:hypothetical protein [Candidatus Paceibacterota bacterium]